MFEETIVLLAGLEARSLSEVRKLIIMKSCLSSEIVYGFFHGWLLISDSLRITFLVSAIQLINVWNGLLALFISVCGKYTLCVVYIRILKTMSIRFDTQCRRNLHKREETNDWKERTSTKNVERSTLSRESSFTPSNSLTLTFLRDSNKRLNFHRQRDPWSSNKRIFLVGPYGKIS